MAITDLFRPKYKHSDAQVRAQAVAQMGTDEADLLVRIAETDRDPEVRRIAVSKIDDAEFLVDLVAHEQNPTVRREAHDRAAAIWSRVVLAGDFDAAVEALGRLAMLEGQGYLAEVILKSEDGKLRAAALTRITDERSLADVVRKSSDSAIRGAALDKIEDPDVLRAIAMDESRKPVGLAAVDKLRDLSSLEALASKAKNRHVRARAQRLKSELEAARRPKVSGDDKRSHAERVQLCRKVKKLVRTDEWVESHAVVTQAQAEWARLGDGDDAELAASFHRSCEKYMARYESVGLKMLEAARRRQEQERAAAAAVVEADEVEEVVEIEAAEPDVDEAQVVSDVDAVVDSSEPEPAAAPKARNEDDEELRAAQRAQRDKVNLARLEALCIELEELHEVDRYRLADRKLSQVGKTFSSLKLPPGDERDRLVERYEAARMAVIVRAKDLREADEWKRWASVPRLEALIARAEALLKIEDVGSLGSELKTLQTEWKAVGPAPHSKNQELWERFKGLADSIYERVKEHRKESLAEQNVNFDKKQALCEEVESLADSTDWDQTAQRIKEIQGEWKQIGPVPRKKSKPQWQRFRAACDAFFERRKPVLEDRLEEQRDNLARKQEVCAAIEALAEADMEWDEVVDKLKELRQGWRQIGHVPREDYAALAARYREAGDRVFARRQQAEQARRDESLREVEELIGKLDTAMQQAGADAGWEEGAEAEDGSRDAMVAAALELRSALLELDEHASEHRERARALIRAAVEANSAAFAGTDLDPQQSRRRRERLIERLEELIPKETEAVRIEQLSAEEVAAKLREALAANALGIVTEEERPVADIVDEIASSWQLLGPVPGREGLELNERFEVARQRVLDDYGDEA